MEIPRSEVGQFSDLNRASKYMDAVAVKKTVGLQAERLRDADNKKGDMNDNIGEVVCLSLPMPYDQGGYAGYNGRGMMTFRPPADAQPAAPARGLARLNPFGRKSKPPKGEPLDGVKNLMTDVNSHKYQVIRSPDGMTYTHECNGTIFKFREDAAGTLHIEEPPA